MRISWSSALETGIRTIDLQHEELIGMINELDDACLARRGKAMLEDVMQRLNNYVTFHFATEEALMAGLAQAEGHTAEHRQQHRLFIEQVGMLRAKAEHEYDETMSALVSFLNNWLYQHILKTDRELGTLLNGQLAQPRAREG